MSQQKRPNPPPPAQQPAANPHSWQHGQSEYITVAWCRACGRTYPIDQRGQLCAQPSCPPLPLLNRSGIVCPEQRCGRFVTRGNLKRHQLTHRRHNTTPP